MMTRSRACVRVLACVRAVRRLGSMWTCMHVCARAFCICPCPHGGTSRMPTPPHCPSEGMRTRTHPRTHAPTHPLGFSLPPSLPLPRLPPTTHGNSTLHHQHHPPQPVQPRSREVPAAPGVLHHTHCKKPCPSADPEKKRRGAGHSRTQTQTATGSTSSPHGDTHPAVRQQHDVRLLPSFTLAGAPGAERRTGFCLLGWSGGQGRCNRG